MALLHILSILSGRILLWYDFCLTGFGGIPGTPGFLQMILAEYFHSLKYWLKICMVCVACLNYFLGFFLCHFREEGEGDAMFCQVFGIRAVALLVAKVQYQIGRASCRERV